MLPKNQSHQINSFGCNTFKNIHTERFPARPLPPSRTSQRLLETDNFLPRPEFGEGEQIEFPVG